MKCWKFGSGRELFSLDFKDDRVSCVAFSPNGRFILSAQNNAVNLWDASKWTHSASQQSSAVPETPAATPNRSFFGRIFGSDH